MTNTHNNNNFFTWFLVYDTNFKRGIGPENILGEDPYPLKTVQTLRLKTKFSSAVLGKVIKRLGVTFPEVRTLILDQTIDDFPIVAPIIWTYMKEMRNLYIEIDLRSDCSQFPFIDGAFTGFSIEMVLSLTWMFEKGDSPVTRSLAESQRLYPSILDCPSSFILT